MILICITVTLDVTQVWCTSGEGVDAMRVVYRMRGLLGDATEEFVETLSQTNAEAVDDEQLYRMANVLADCGQCSDTTYLVVVLKLMALFFFINVHIVTLRLST